MASSIYEHYDFLTTISIIIGGFFLTIIGYLIRSWKVTVDEGIQKLFSTQTESEKFCIKEYVTKEDCRSIEHSVQENLNNIFNRLDDIAKDIKGQHGQVMYELGIRNGTHTRKSKYIGRDDDETTG